jgi:hypothetical protein
VSGGRVRRSSLTLPGHRLCETTEVGGKSPRQPNHFSANLLSLSFSSNDAVGCDRGLNSRQLLDATLRPGLTAKRLLDVRTPGVRKAK